VKSIFFFWTACILRLLSILYYFASLRLAWIALITRELSLCDMNRKTSFSWIATQALRYCKLEVWHNLTACRPFLYKFISCMSRRFLISFLFYRHNDLRTKSANQFTRQRRNSWNLWFQFMQALLAIRFRRVSGIFRPYAPSRRLSTVS
jgi:hypothetical protein